MNSKQICVLILMLVATVQGMVAQNTSIHLIKDYDKCTKIKLNSAVNSDYYEGQPMLTPNGKTLWFYRKGHPTNVGYRVSVMDEDIWFAKKNESGDWNTSVNVGIPLNNSLNSGVCGMSADANILFVYDFYYGSFNGLAVTFRSANGWTYPRHIVIEDFYMLNDLVWLHVSADTKYVLMSLQRNESYGKGDIYVSIKQPNGYYSKPINLGPVVNSYDEELSPFLAIDNKTLYYASRGKKGYGNYDLFVTKRLDDTWTNWSEPQNLGPKINTPDWDCELSISADGNEAYMVSGGKEYGDNSDIYKIDLPELVQPEKQVLVVGYLKEYQTEKPLQGEIKFYKNNNSKDAGTALSDPKTGYFHFYVEKNSEYTFKPEKENYLSVLQSSSSIKFTDSINTVTLYLSPIEAGKKVDLQNIYFERSKFEILPNSMPQLQEIRNMLVHHPQMRIRITGHTENIGNAEKNKLLSLDRANAVKKWLVENGIDTNRLETDGKGGEELIVPMEDAENSYKNRRVEFLILSR